MPAGHHGQLANLCADSTAACVVVVASLVAQLAAQHRDLSSRCCQLLTQQQDLRCRRVPVDDGLVLDIPRTIGVAQRVDRLLHVRVGRRDTGNHDSVRVVAQRILKQPSELRVPVRYMLLAIDQRLDDVSQG
jgi:hypothetical protein